MASGDGKSMLWGDAARNPGEMMKTRESEKKERDKKSAEQQKRQKSTADGDSKAMDAMAKDTTFDGKVRHFAAPRPHSKTLDNLQRSLIHAKAEELHEAHRQQLDDITNSAAGWSNTGSAFDVEFYKIPKDLQRQLQTGDAIGEGGSGVVRRIVFRDVPLCKKTIFARSRGELERLKSEVAIGKKLDGHRHVVRLVGTYTTSANGELFLNILTFPVAACDLNTLLDDCEALNGRYRDLSLKQACDISLRFIALGWPDSYPLWKTHDQLNPRLKEVMGCLAKAVKWMHSQNVQHRDLKPQNVLLRPGQVYLTDFGISRSAKNMTTQSYMGSTRGFAAPEVEAQEDTNPAQADIYSLGCIYLHILTVLVGERTGARRKTISAILMGETSKREAEIGRYMEEELQMARNPEDVGKRVTIKLLAPLLANDRRSRPDARKVDSDLWGAGGSNHIFHGACCKGTPGASISN